MRFGSECKIDILPNGFKEEPKNITSKGGTTEKAINIFENNGLEEKFIEGINGAYEKSKNINN
ncbi:MAG: pyrroline-5-carboxylate reductase dimerization domain-containing protein [Candidatus Gracilibacteria bacterium]|nr:pyrroline-5-carboxylate reductase dimerization domain-containing protein [Candidatus Gracilibacteria bacterium]